MKLKDKGDDRNKTLKIIPPNSSRPIPGLMSGTLSDSVSNMCVYCKTGLEIESQLLLTDIAENQSGNKGI
jgi:hypothetical protein